MRQYRVVAHIRNKPNNPGIVVRIRVHPQSERKGRAPRVKRPRSLRPQAQSGGCLYELRWRSTRNLMEINLREDLRIAGKS